MKKYERGKRSTDSSNTMESLLTMRQACRMLYVHGNTLRRWSAKGLIKVYRIGPSQHRRFKTEDVSALLLERIKFGPNDVMK
jgi:excisionase family DNA binding protein